jgi:hypothetical protein
MNANWLFVCGVAVAAAVSLAVVAYLRRPLLRILVDLCGHEDRAKFWLAFSNVTVTLTPLLFALHQRPSTDSHAAPIFEFADQLEIALLGLVISVFVLGFVLGRFIPRGQRSVTEKQAANRAA